MANSTERLQVMAKNHHVFLFRNQPLDDDDLELLAECPDMGPNEFDHYPEHPVGTWIVCCPECERTWAAPTITSGLKRYWWQCPDFCNVSQQTALRHLRDLDAGGSIPPKLREACEERVLSTKCNPRKETIPRYFALVAEQDAERDRRQLAEMMALLDGFDKENLSPKLPPEMSPELSPELSELLNAPAPPKIIPMNVPAPPEWEFCPTEGDRFEEAMYELIHEFDGDNEDDEDDPFSIDWVGR